VTGQLNTPPLSRNQELLCALDNGPAAGALSEWYTINYGLRVGGAIDTNALKAALDDIVARHEILRSSLVRTGERWNQVIHPPAPVNLTVRDMPQVPLHSRHVRAHQLLNEIEARPFPAGEVPLLRAELVRFDAGDSLLVLTTHHIASDAWSMGVIIRDLRALYAARGGHLPHGLPDACQYRDFALWQHASEDADLAARRYWRQKLPGARILAIQADRVLPPDTADPYSVHRFTIDAELVRATAALAARTRSSLFVVLLAAYNLLARRLTGSADLTVPTFTSGRGEDRFGDAVGPYYNLLPVRTGLEDCATFLDVIARTRASCLEAYSHDIPFVLITAEAGDLMKPCARDDLEVAAFEMLPAAAATSERAADVTFSELRDRQSSQPIGASTPRGLLWALDRLRSGEIAGAIRYSRHRFEEGTIPGLAVDYRRALSAAVMNPAAALD
jgi:condensation enzyme